MNQEQTSPMVSVWMITYNHEPYIAQAIEGVLMQKANFRIELVIGEDCSTDNTANIIEDYKNRYPEIIKARRNPINIGMIPNMVKTLEECDGKYIALCEGDDYWTDEYKLQKQVDFLEQNKKYSGAAHQSSVSYEDPNNITKLFSNVAKETIKLKDLLDGRMFHTASFIFRSEFIEKIKLPTNITSGDRALFLLIASFGNIYYSNKTMCCYRKNNGGISNWVTVEMMEKDLNIVPWLCKINSKFPKHKYYKFIHSTIINYPAYISKPKLITHSFWLIFHSFADFPNNIRPIKRFLINQMPNIWAKTNIIKC